jgi:hypothetical protein
LCATQARYSRGGAPTVSFTTFGASPQRDGIVPGLSAAHALATGLRVTW